MIATASFALGNRLPARVDEPEDAAAVAAALRAASDAGRALVAFGGGTLQSLGNVPVRYDIALSLARLNAVAAYDPRDLTIGFEAGVTLAHAAAVLAENGQFIPFDAPSPERATIGGTLAAGWAGPRRATYGRLRDLVIGSTVALADGTLASAGGMVVKNVTGYDMSKLYIGSLGTLGIITRANFKALPKPPVARMALAPLPDDARERTIAALVQLDLAPTAMLIVSGFAADVPRARDEDARLFVLFEGTEAATERATRDLRSALGAAGVPETRLSDGAAAEALLQRVIDAGVTSLADRSITYRTTGVPSDAWERAGTIRALARACNFAADDIVDLATGDVIARIAARSASALANDLHALDARLRERIPNATVLAGEPAVRALVDAWGPPPATLATMRDLKARFDPREVLAPGRYVGGI